MADATTVQQSARDQGLFVEALALKIATQDSGDADLSTRAQRLYANVVTAASNAGSTWRLYMPSWLGGGYGDEAEAIAAEFKARHGFDPLDVTTTPPTSGPSADVEALASGSPERAATAGIATFTQDAGDKLTHYGKWLLFALVLLLVGFVALEAASIVRAVKE